RARHAHRERPFRSLECNAGTSGRLRATRPPVSDAAIDGHLQNQLCDQRLASVAFNCRPRNHVFCRPRGASLRAHWCHVRRYGIRDAGWFWRCTQPSQAPSRRGQSRCVISMTDALPLAPSVVAEWMPLAKAAGFFLATFVLEDVAAVGAGLLLATGEI